MKTKEEILLDNVGSLKLSGLKWKSLNDRKELVHKAMQEYADQQLAEYKEQVNKHLDVIDNLLAACEDTAHGSDGRMITKSRGLIITIQKL